MSIWSAGPVCVWMLVALFPTAADATRPLTLGFDDPLFAASNPLGAEWLQRAGESGASFVRIGVSWSSIEPVRPAHPADPADTAYRWQELDQTIVRVRARGLQPLLTVGGAPAWAEGPGRPAGVSAGAWRPNPHAFGRFAHALAERYSGAYPDPSDPRRRLPRITYLQPWNEPNLSLDLAPQWVHRGGRWRARSPDIYRSLLNAFYAGVKSAVPDDVVVSAGTAPFGDLSPGEHDVGNQRMPPVPFVRDLLCLRGLKLTPARCPHPAHLDVLDHHPYAVGGPFQHALDPGDVSIAEMYKLRELLARARRTGRVLPRGNKPLWVTEVSWDTDPPDPEGVPMRQDVRWVPQALYQLWRQGVSMVMWFLIRDQPPSPSYATTYQSGMYLLNGHPKPSQRAFRFPFLLVHRRHRSELWWTRAPRAGRLVVQQRTRDRWRIVFSCRVRKFEVIERAVPASGQGSRWRARVGGTTSLVWRE